MRTFLQAFVILGVAMTAASMATMVMMFGASAFFCGTTSGCAWYYLDMAIRAVGAALVFAFPTLLAGGLLGVLFEGR